MKRTLVLVFGLALVLAQQAAFFHDRGALSRQYRLRASAALTDSHKAFTYFLYYLGLFPVAPRHPLDDLDYSREGARALLKRGDVTTDLDGRLRFGEIGKVYLCLPGALLKGSAEHPSPVAAHVIAFTASLLLLYFMFWRSGLAGLGLAAALLFGSDPFQVFETYSRPNVFSWPITAAVAALALHVPFITERGLTRAVSFGAPTVAGVFLATVRQIRTEPAVIAASVLVVYLLSGKAAFRRRVAWILLFAAAYAGAASLWGAHFAHKIRESREAVASVGGHLSRAEPRRYHVFWHPVWCGLGDFDRKYGHAWSDTRAVAAAEPLLRSRYGEEASEDQSAILLPHYEETLRAEVLGRVRADPAWYAEILARRFRRVLTDTTPVRLAAGRHGVTLPWNGLLTVPLLAALFAAKKKREAVFIVFFLPTSFTALFIFSGNGTPYYSAWHVMAAAVAIAWAAEAGLRKALALAAFGRVK